MTKIAILIDGGYLRVRASCEEYSGTAKLPVSGNTRTFIQKSTLLDDLAKKQLFAVRRGVLKFRGFKPKVIPVATAAVTDADVKPDFEQKGVDMRIGLDIALFCQTRAIERIVLMTNDTDTIPAMKYARRAGLQVVLIEIEASRLAADLPAHADFIRPVLWPQ